MTATVYLETSIIGYLTSRPSRDLITAAAQQLTHQWWDDHREKYGLYVSHFVISECSAGDPTAAQERLEVLADIQLLDTTEEVDALARRLLTEVPLPERAHVDAFHIAIAAVNGINHLLTWNCAHIANAALRTRIDEVCRDMQCEPPIICTPQELMED